MAHAPSHAHRNTHHHLQIGAREQYATTTPSFRRASEHLSRSPPFAARRHQLTASQSSLVPPAAGRMEAGQYGGRQSQQGGAPPLQPVQTLGSLQYVDQAMTPIKVDITGKMEKGPFLSRDQEWTCYRRNYLACVCSYSLHPLLYPNVPIQFVPGSSGSAAQQQPVQVYGFAMCISAVVAENEQQNIELVQHTPKRDKGPINKPSKVPLAPKTGQSCHHYADSASRPYADSQQPTPTNGQVHQLPSEHMFERIQFKHATLNNGKRRAAQQYYHLIVELWADVGTQLPDQFVKVAYRKSAKMIVRGRSPGHYQNERRESQGDGPGGSAGSMGGYGHIGSMADFGSSQMLATGPYAATPYSSSSATNDSRGAANVYRQPHDLASADDAAALVTPDDAAKMALDGSSKTYQQHYYYDAQHDRPDVYHARPAPDGILPSIAAEAKVKSEYEFGGMLPRPYGISTASVTTPRMLDTHHQPQHQHHQHVHHQHQHPLLHHHSVHHPDHHHPRHQVQQRQQPDQFADTKTTSAAYYPSIVSPTGTGIHMTIA
ncbi:hypothetical protein CDD82_5816 [Ophiocordyceps australis]|uniref:NDT80 domain-containing protein n=1 Tax=Ophiocordyceps australis TaxID=1399860 RepID=A0A2C5ZRL9_9HYPO|nr:hypothetical protein CDD82_5816 [Ophiocordyceps australis]